MKTILPLLSAIILLSLSTETLAQQYHLDVEGHSKIRGNIDIGNMDDTSSVLIGSDAGLNTDFSSKRAVTMVGNRAGLNNTTGVFNCFFGPSAGESNLTGNSNCNFGVLSGGYNTTGSCNCFYGNSAGVNSNTGSNNTFIGAGASNESVGNQVDKSIAIGYYARVDCSNCAVIGGTGDNAVNVGIGTETPIRTLDVRGELLVKQSDGLATFESSSSNSFITLSNNNGANATSVGYYHNGGDKYFYVNTPEGGFGEFIVRANGNTGIGIEDPEFLLHVDGSAGKPGGGSWSTPSDRRLKKDITPYTDGLEKILRIDPVKFHYNEKSGMSTEEEYVGIIAQDMKKVAPYTVSKTWKGERAEEEYLVFDPNALTYMLINAVQEHEKANKEQRELVANQQSQIDRLLREITEIRALLLGQEGLSAGEK